LDREESRETGGLLSGLRRAIQEPRFGLAAFLIPLGIRAIPEIIAGPYPVGFDTINYYVPWSVRYPFNVAGFFMEPAMVFWLLNSLTFLSRISPFLEMKIIFPLAFGLLGFSLFQFLTRAIDNSKEKALFVSLFVMSQVATLRLSWDQLRIVLGLSATLVLPLVNGRTIDDNVCARSQRPKLPGIQDLARPVLGVLAVLSNQLSGLLAVVLSWKMSYSQADTYGLKRFFWPIPATIFLALEVYPYFAPVGLVTGDRVRWVPMGVSDPRFSGVDLASGMLYPLTLILFLLLPLIPLALIGRTRNTTLFTLLGAVSAGAIGSLLVHAASGLYWIWLIALGWILSIYAGLGVWNLCQHRRKSIRLFRKAQRLRLRPQLLVLGIVLIFALLYSSTDRVLPNSYFNTYVPGGLLYSSVAISRTNDVQKAIAYVNENAPYGGNILVEEPFKGWAEINLRNDLSIWLVPGLTPLNVACASMKNLGITPDMVVYSTSGLSGTGANAPSNLRMIQSYEILAVYSVA
jgi:hypothetical protein